MDTREIKASGFSFTAFVAGPADGTPVLLLHGFPQSRHTWTRQIETLAAAGFRCIAPDQRGYSPGARPAGTGNYALDAIVGDALAIMDTMDAPRFHLAGHDWGGQIAWSTAIRAPERVITLSVLSRPHPAAFAEAWAKDPDQPARSGHHKSLLLPETIKALREGDLKTFRSLFHAQGVPDANAENYIRTLAEPGALEAAIEWYRAAAVALRTPAPAVRVPALFLWGDRDSTVGRYAAEATARFVDAPYVFMPIEGAGHFLTDQVPDRVNEALLKHLAAAG
jgi:pimeloyl-ACP methyl ester carboxylesterase